MMLASSIIKTSNSPTHPLSSLPPPGPPPTDALPGLPTQSLSSAGLDPPVSIPLATRSTTRSSSSSSSFSPEQSSSAPFRPSGHDQSYNAPFLGSHAYDPSSRPNLHSQGRSFNPHRQQALPSVQPSVIQPVRSQTISTSPSRNSLLLSARPSFSTQSQGLSFFDRSSVGMPRTPSRLLLQQALDLAQIAVGLDQAQDFHEAVVRYQETVSMLRIVIARIESRGNQSKAGIGDGRDDQGLTLKGIHDAYLSRISMLQEQLNPPDVSFLSDPTLESDHYRTRLDRGSSPAPVRAISPTMSRTTSSSSESIVPLVMSSFHRPRRLSYTATEAESLPGTSTTEPSHISYLDRSASTTSSYRSSHHSRTQLIHNTPVSPLNNQLSNAQISSDESADQSRTIPTLNVNPELNTQGNLPPSHTPNSRSLGDEPDRSAFQRRQSLIESLGLLSDDNAGAKEAMDVTAKTRKHVLEDVQESPRSIAKELEMGTEGELSDIDTKPASERSIERRVEQPLSQEAQAEASVALSIPDLSPSSEREGYGGYISHEDRALSQSNQRPIMAETPSSELFNSSTPFPSSVSLIARKELSPPTQLVTVQSQSPNQLLGSSLNGRSISGHSSLYPSIPLSVSTIEGSPSLLSTSPPNNGHDRMLNHQSTDQFAMSPPLARTTSTTTPALPLPSAQTREESRTTLLEPVPSNVLRRPFHIMRALRLTMVTSGGSYLTPRLHVPSGVWFQTGVFLQAVDTKVQVIHVLVDYLQAMEKTSMPLVSTITPTDMGSNSKLAAIGVEFLSLLDSWENVMETVQTTLAKKNVVQHSKKGKNGGSNWGFKISRGLDRLANGKNIDTLQAYSSSLKKLFAQSQFLVDILQVSSNSKPSLPNAPYLCLPLSIRVQIEARLKRTSEFFGQVIVAFVLKDLMLLLDKYTKNVEKWILE